MGRRPKPFTWAGIAIDGTERPLWVDCRPSCIVRKIGRCGSRGALPRVLINILCFGVIPVLLGILSGSAAKSTWW
jgi:hypothetical protein